MASQTPLTVVCCGQTCELPTSLDLRGLLSFWLLWELRLGPLSGAQLSERLGWRRGDRLSPGTLYPALAGLEKVRLVRKARRGRDTSYELTTQGRRELACAATCLRAIFRDVLGEEGRPASSGRRTASVGRLRHAGRSGRSH